MKVPLLIAFFAAAVPAFAETIAETDLYPSGLKQTVSIGEDLYTTLDAPFQRELNPEVVVVENRAQPLITPIPATKPGGPGRLAVSTGFIELVNHIAHAKAIDRVEPGYFKAYVRALAQPGADTNPPAPPHLEDARFWTDDVMKRQAGLFNQIIGISLAVNLSHYYLDHYSRHQAQMISSAALPLNDYLNNAEWEQSVVDATVNSLDCALATEGAKTLCEAFAEMPVRPRWADCIVPQGANLKKLERELAHYEDLYFHSDRWLRRRVARSLTAK